VILADFSGNFIVCGSIKLKMCFRIDTLYTTIDHAVSLVKNKPKKIS